MTSTALAMIYHDPEGRLFHQLQANLPAIMQLFDGVAVQTSYVSYAPALDKLKAAGVIVEQDTPAQEEIGRGIGRARRRSLALALQYGTSHILYCDLDRLLHWIERYPAELADVIKHLPDFDFTVLGRTARAFDSHPRIQRDTELLVNHVFGLVSGLFWDVTAATRGFSRRAAERLIVDNHDDQISVDVSWLLTLLREKHLTHTYRETEGLEFETADRHPDEIASAGGLAKWIDQLDADPRLWFQRLYLACIEVEAMMPFIKQDRPQ